MTAGAAQRAADGGYAGPALLPVAATLLALAGVRVGEVVVDAGCGAGLFTHPAAAAAGTTGRAFGVDGDPASLAAARARRPSPVCWVRGEPDRLPFASHTVDKVLAGAAGLTRGGPDPRDPAALAEYARLLLPGGRLALVAWGTFAAGDAEVALGAELTARGVDHGTEDSTANVAERLHEVGLRVVHETADDVVLAFADGAAYAAWRLSTLPAVAREPGAAIGERLAAALGPGPVTARAQVNYVTATPERT